jgi:hypothetical protein
MTHVRGTERLTKRPSEADILVALEHERWRLIQRKDLNSFASHLAEDFYDIFPDGRERTKAELLDFLREAELRDFRLDDFRVTLLNEDAAVVMYQVEAHALIAGQPVSMNNSVTSGWARRDGKWLNIFAVASPR